MQLSGRRPVWHVLAGALFAAAALVLAAKIAARLHHDDVIWGLAGYQLPGDFGVFLRAAEDVVGGRTPYPEVGTLAGPPNAYYVYPPPLALLLTPLTVPPIGIASTIFTLLGIAAIVAALLLLDVRDWRCHVLAFLYPFTREALEYGAIGSFLLLFGAVLWRYRDRLMAPALATAGAVVLKLFLWPLFVWLALTRRLRTAVLAAAVAASAALATWAVILFRGILDYPQLLRELSELEAEYTFSTFAFLRALELPSLLAQALIVVGGAALLAAAAREARSPDRDAVERDRRSLILVLAAALVLTPILWLHYLVLLLLPLALARPRLSPLWLVPLAAVIPSWLGWYGGWTDGDLAELGSALGIAAAVFAGSLRRRGSAVRRARPAPSV